MLGGVSVSVEVSRCVTTDPDVPCHGVAYLMRERVYECPAVKIGRDVADYNVRKRLRASWRAEEDAVRWVAAVGLVAQHFHFNAIYQPCYAVPWGSHAKSVMYPLYRGGPRSSRNSVL